MGMFANFIGFLLLLLVPLFPVSADEGLAPESSNAPQTFDVLEFRVSGNTLLETMDIERAVLPYMGPSKTLADIEAARTALEQRYRDAGFATVFVSIPEQEVKNGTVHLKVDEARVESFRVKGSRYFTPSSMRAMVSAAAPGEKMFMPEVQRQLTALNVMSPDRSVTPVLRPGRTPGTVEIELRVKDELPLYGSVELNNQASQDTTDLRALASLRYDNLWQRGHGINVQYQTAPKDTSEMRVWSGTYNWRLQGSGEASPGSVLFYAVKSDSNTATLGSMSVIGEGNIFGVRGLLPFGLSAAGYHSLSLGAEFKDFKENIELQGADVANTPIDYLGFSVQYDSVSSSENVSTQWSIGPSFGVRGFGNTMQEFEDKRFNARPNYFYLRGRVEHNREWSSRWRSIWRASAQLSTNPLISNEQFSAGGSNTVRGYYESQALGDYGVVGGLELQSPSLAQSLGEQARELRVLAFVDGAALRIHDPLPGQDTHHELSSAGIGLRFTLWKTFNARMDWARVFKAAGEVEAGDHRVHFSIEYLR
jgi:hemolysin activation/secretion protein